MRIGIFGAGAVGSLFGALLSREHEVLLVGRRPQVEAIQASGLKITGITEEVFEIRASTGLGAFDPDIVILTVKAYDTRAAAEGLGAQISPQCHVMSLQNGLENLEELRKALPGIRIIAGLTSHGVTLQDWGRIKHAGTGDTVVGDPVGGSEDMAAEMVRALNDCGIRTRMARDMRKEIWTKAGVNAAINPITAITGHENGVLLVREELSRVMEEAATEAARVALARGVDIRPEEVVGKAREVATLTADNRSSMLQDVRRCKRTEVDSICGAISRRGEISGVDTPVNRCLAALIKGIEAGYLE